MPWPRPPRLRSRQSKPSTRTAAGWNANRARAHDAPRGDMDGATDGRGFGRATATATGAAATTAGSPGRGTGMGGG